MRSSISSNMSLLIITSASWNTSRRAWRTMSGGHEVYEGSWFDRLTMNGRGGSPSRRITCGHAVPPTC